MQGDAPEGRTIIISGMSGSGKSTALRALEDVGFFCVDNLPVALLPKFLELRQGTGSEITKTALVMDVREQSFLSEFPRVFHQLQEKGYQLEMLFLDSSDEVLARRFSQTRRQHPFGEGESMLAAIGQERAALNPLKRLATKVIDTSLYNVHQLRERVSDLYTKGLGASGMTVHFVSFGFKYGLPYEADLVADVRFLPNPYFVPELKELDGLDDEVIDYVMKYADTRDFLERYTQMLEFLLPRYAKEGKRHLTIAVGCTGGRHRSVVVAAQLMKRLTVRDGVVKLTHRDIQFG
jgi:UPF0042 nucleotide-binding protein